MIPEFAVVGHPNEGKSSVVSTLTEDDQIRVSRIPGETVVCRTYTVKIGGKEIIRFVDTPGFQVPRQTLAWFSAYAGDPETIVDEFVKTHQQDPFFKDECELLGPVARGAGIIYVVDGSRPVRGDDLAEMEILRLSGRPRMAVINSKTQASDYTAQWQREFRKQFNAIRVFNSNTAGFSDRMKMLESLKAIDQEWEDALSIVIEAFHQDWQKRNRLAAKLICETLEKCLVFSTSIALRPEDSEDTVRTTLNQAYEDRIRTLEKQMFKKIRQLFRHHLYDHHLPACSLLHHDLFARQTWELLGLTRKQLAAAGAIAGGTMGAVMDTAAAGVTFGVFSALGGLFGAGSALWGAGKLAGSRAGGIKLGGDRLRLGPCKNIQFLYVLLDRALIYYSHMVNQPHGRRDYRAGQVEKQKTKQGFSDTMASDQKQTCAHFFKSVATRSVSRKKRSSLAFEALIESMLNQIST